MCGPDFFDEIPCNKVTRKNAATVFFPLKKNAAGGGIFCVR